MTSIPDSLRPPELSAEQAAVLAGWDAALLVLGGPGTGKTTLLAHAAVARSRGEDPPPLVVAAGRTAASSLRNSIAAQLGDGSWQPAVATVHSLCRTIWQRFAGRPELRLLAAPEQEFRVRELLAGSGAAYWPGELRPALGTRGFAAQVRAAIARARQLGLEPEDLTAFGAEAGRPEWQALGGFFAEYLDVLDAEGVLDYAELVHRVRLLLTDLTVTAGLHAEIGAVLIDDYTELDPAQIALLATLAGSAPVLAVADPDSVSSTFRGAHPRALADFERFFGRREAPARFTSLAAGHRHGAAIGGALAGVRARLPRPAGTGRLDSIPADTAGSVQVFTCSGEADQAATIAAEIRRARLTDGIRYGDMAVLVRSGRRQLGPIVRSLAAAGIPVEVAGDEIPLAQAPSVRPLLLALAVTAAGRVAPDEAVRLLTSPLAGFDALGLRRLAREWRAGLATPPAGLPEQLAAAINEPGWLAGAAANPVTERLRRFLDVLAAAGDRVRAGDPVDLVAWTLWQGTDWPRQLARESAAGGPLGSRADADLDALCALFESAAEADRRGGVAGVRAFLAELAGQQIPADRERESRLRGRGVQVLTAHRARGREWELVVVAGVQEGVWPAGRRVSTVLESAALTGDGLTGRTDHRDLLAAERRLFHLACSRARSRLVVTAAAGTEGEADSPSRFLAELGVPLATPDRGGAPLTLAALAAELRRHATDPAVPVELRAAAAGELARLADAADDSGRPLVPSADPATWWGVRELSSRPEPLETGRPVRLSPSQVTGILTCPRRYFLAREARGEGEPGLAAALGSLIHLLVQQAVEEGWGLPELRAGLDAVWHRLRFEAAWLSATERVEVELGLARFLAWRAANPAELVGVEVPFNLEIAVDDRTVVLDGKVDWLERTAAGLRVVDFKTSRTPPTRAAIAGMEQLGIYQLAVAAGGFGQVGPEPGAAGAAAVYLRLAGKPEDLPREFSQSALATNPYLGEDAAELRYPSWVHHRVALAAAVVSEGSYPATPGPHCRTCPFANSCPASGRGGQVLR
ncbi:MAG: ATP-dependent helicase [Propionibacteriaceae bacterium]|nr:ATP-dependent helicase [Propionibacteriaceae bacterium]